YMAFSSVDTIIDFLEPVSASIFLNNDENFNAKQLGKHIDVYAQNFPDVASADLIMIGCGEARGAGVLKADNSGIDAVRKHFYNLYHWHADVKIADIGNIKSGASLDDTHSALLQVLSELSALNKKVVIIGGSHDIMMAQYNVFASQEKIIEATCVDAFLDMNADSRLPADNFLMKLFTDEPNYLKHYNHIGFQSYFVHPAMLETIDKLRFDCYRVGVVKEHMETMEPVIREANIFAFDITAIQHSHAPANRVTPNGFNGEEACMLLQFAGMSALANSIGIYGYNAAQDVSDLTAKQISHMLWYLLDGIQKGKQEAPLNQREDFSEFKLMFADFETMFLQSKKTQRWWMQLPDKTFVACSERDYATALHNEIPERWLRAAERS
ncbi:MAG: arginase family protein, partial [Parafilimonas sp.]